MEKKLNFKYHKKIPSSPCLLYSHSLVYLSICWVHTCFPLRMGTSKEKALLLIYSSIPYAQNILEAQEMPADWVSELTTLTTFSFFNPMFPRKICNISLNWNKRNIYISIRVKNELRNQWRDNISDHRLLKSGHREGLAAAGKIRFNPWGLFSQGKKSIEN